MCSVVSAEITFGGKFAREILIITASDENLNVNFGLIMSDVCMCDNEMQAIKGNCTTLSFQLINYERTTLRIVMNGMNFVVHFPIPFRSHADNIDHVES
jgi:hypothetical protein